jgi:HK97 family phage prohead protease
MNFSHWTSTQIEEKALQEEMDYFSLKGYAATYDRDRVDDVIVPGAFKKCLERMNETGDSLQLYFNHDLKAPPIGAIVSCSEDRKGLKYEAHLPKDDTFVRDRIVPQIKRRALKSNSFGYKVKEFERRKSDGARLLKTIDIFEISVVGIPANPAANIDSIKGIVPFADLPIDRESKSWDAKAAFARLKAKLGDRPDDLKSAFLFADEDKPVDQWDLRFLIADIDDSGCLKAANQALLKSSAFVFGGGDVLPQGAEESVGEHLERYFTRLNLPSPSKSWSVTEFEAQDESEREARLRGLGVSRDLAKKMLSGLREADRSQTLREAGSSTEDAQKLFAAAFSELAQAALRRL